MSTPGWAGRAAWLVAATVFATSALAQDFPSRDVTFVVPFAPGGGTDSTARIAAAALKPLLGASVIVENRSGGATALGISYVAKSQPDGYTLAWATSDGLSILPAIKPDLSYTLDDFEFVATTGRYSLAVAVNPKHPFKTLQELIAYAKANPGKLTYSTAGVGGGSHLAAALISRTAGFEWTHVPYRGSAPAVTDAVAGHVDATIAAPASIKPHSDTGALRVLAVSETTRHPQYPDVPTLTEAGVPTSVVLYNGVLAPRGTPAPVLARLRKDLQAMVLDPKVAARMREIGYEPEFLEGQSFKDFMVKDSARWKEVAKAFNISVTD
jgi:tripartite-type tricarboxylate transporter receptor subunit TctC